MSCQQIFYEKVTVISFFKKYFNTFQNEELLESYKTYCKNSNYSNKVPPKKFTIKIDKSIIKEIEVPKNIFNHECWM